MTTVKFEKGQVQVIAHRGLSGIERENTNAAFVAAGNRSYYGIETDIHRTADGKFVICHDATLTRVAGENICVGEVSLSLLQSIVLFDKDDTKNRADLRPSTLENYISICKKYGKTAVLELKRRMTTESIAGIVEEIRRLDYLDHTIFISFSLMNMQDVRRMLPDQKVQYLVSAWDNDLLEVLKKDRLDLDIAGSQVTPELVKRLHDNGIEINCWTIDSPESAAKLVEMGVDYITSNILE